MPRSVTLSHAAIDILLERHSLGLAPFPFEITGNGRTETERAGVRAAVLADLRRRNLDESEIEELLRVFARPRVAITAFVKFDAEHRLFARGCSTSQSTMRAVGDGNRVRFEVLRRAALVSSTVASIPDERPGVGQSVTYTDTTSGGQQEEQGFSRMVRPARTTPGAQREAAARMLALPKVRLGQFRIVVRGRHGREDSSPDLFWFDTDKGRYAVFSSTASDGRIWTTCMPADNARIASHLSEQLDQLLPKR